MPNEPKPAAPSVPSHSRLTVRTHVQAGTLAIRPRKAPRFPLG